jgi:hypothetical protein
MVAEADGSGLVNAPGRGEAASRRITLCELVADYAAQYGVTFADASGLTLEQIEAGLEAYQRLRAGEFLRLMQVVNIAVAAAQGKEAWAAYEEMAAQLKREMQ